MDRNTLIGLTILGVAAVIGLSFFRKFLAIVIALLVGAVGVWYLYLR